MTTPLLLLALAACASHRSAPATTEAPPAPVAARSVPAASKDYDPRTLPEVDSVQVFAIGSLGLTAFHDNVGIAIAQGVAPVILDEETAQLVADLWRGLAPGLSARCHSPPFAVRLALRSGGTLDASLCWECSNLYGSLGGRDITYGFDAEHPAAKLLLEELQRVTADAP